MNMAARTRRNKVAGAMGNGVSDGMSGGSLGSDLFAVDQRVVVVKFLCCRVLGKLLGVFTLIVR
jgi:hypothetical protein